jgi:hypothetical protein
VERGEVRVERDDDAGDVLGRHVTGDQAVLLVPLDQAGDSAPDLAAEQPVGVASDR